MAQRLSGLNLVPLAHNKTYFTIEELKQKTEAMNIQKVKQNVNAISMEFSVIRKQKSVFDYEEMKKAFHVSKRE